MIQVNSLHHNTSARERQTRSHILTPHDAVTLFCIVDGTNESIVSIIEDHLLESISSTEWSARQVQEDFGYVTEHYNSFIANLPTDDAASIRILIAMLQGDTITLSTIGGAQGILLERAGKITDISVHENKSIHFQAVSSGRIPDGATVYLANDDISHILGDEVLYEMSQLSPESWSETGKGILERDISTNLHIIRVSNANYQKDFSSNRQGSGKSQSAIIKQKGAIVLEYLRSKKMWENTRSLITKVPVLQKGKYQYAFLLLGLVILFILAYSLISTIVGVFNTGAIDTKNMIIQAKVLVDEGEKLMANPQAFDTKIAEAEKIILELRKEQKHLTNTQDLLGRIAAMKKKVYDIQTIDMTHLVSIIPFNSADINPLGVFQRNNKFSLIGEKGAILEYAPGDVTSKVTMYPGGESAKEFDAGEEGSAYILTKDKRILGVRRDGFAYANVTGQPTWEDADNIATFNGNIYLLNAAKNQIGRHKPGVNGFSQKSDVLPKEQPGIFGFSIDGGFYIYTEDGKIYRSIGGTDIKTITLNKIPGEWNINPGLKSEFITKTNLSYTYILNGNKIWIFQPNSKRFQDINAWTYIAQFELKTDDTIKSLSIPRDGIIYVTTDKGVYELKFEVIDGKIVFK